MDVEFQGRAFTTWLTAVRLILLPEVQAAPSTIIHCAEACRVDMESWNWFTVVASMLWEWDCVWQHPGPHVSEQDLNDIWQAQFGACLEAQQRMTPDQRRFVSDIVGRGVHTLLFQVLVWYLSLSEGTASALAILTPYVWHAT